MSRRQRSPIRLTETALGAIRPTPVMSTNADGSSVVKPASEAMSSCRVTSLPAASVGPGPPATPATSGAGGGVVSGTGAASGDGVGELGGAPRVGPERGEGWTGMAGAMVGVVGDGVRDGVGDGLGDASTAAVMGVDVGVGGGAETARIALPLTPALDAVTVYVPAVVDVQLALESLAGAHAAPLVTDHADTKRGTLFPNTSVPVDVKVCVPLETIVAVAGSTLTVTRSAAVTASVALALTALLDAVIV